MGLVDSQALPRESANLHKAVGHISNLKLDTFLDRAYSCTKTRQRWLKLAFSLLQRDEKVSENGPKTPWHPHAGLSYRVS
jgi:redox-sensitive bicupin YhaK (pirin superfamily)